MRAFDISIAAIGLLVALPVMALVAGLTWLLLGRPIIFSQMRTGLHGRTFRLVKFRTMTQDRDARGKLLPDDQRITRFGRLVRRTRLDELPELWNVLVGDMAVIGPRPLLPHTIAEAGELGMRRSTVRPGLTGWAQVNGCAMLRQRDKMLLDLWYIEHRSLALHARILARTAGFLLFGDKVNAAEVGTARESYRRRRG